MAKECETLPHRSNVGYVEKVDAIAEEDRNIARASLAEIAESLQGKYPKLSLREVNKLLHEWLDISV